MAFPPFGFFAQRLTDFSNNLVDWKRVAARIRGGATNYTATELLIRGSMIGIAALSAFLAHYLNDEQKTGCSDTTAAIAIGITAFVLSHVAATYPLIQKRYKVSRECQQLSANILSELAKVNPSLLENCSALIKQILQTSVQHQHNATASQTWGQRKRLLTDLLAHCKTPDDPFWQQGVSAMFSSLTTPPSDSNRPSPL